MINEFTKISLGIAITLIGGGAGWMSAISLQGSTNQKTLDSMESRIEKYSESLQTIEKDVAIIRTKLELMTKGIRHE